MKALAMSALLLLALLGLKARRRTEASIDGCTIKFSRDRDFAWVSYREPSGRTLTLDAYPSRHGDQRSLWVEFPAEVVFWEGVFPSEHPTANFNISVSPGQPIPEEEADLVRRRISGGLTRMKIPHEFISARRSGWTSFENGKEVYHG
jgi:hypothetical protein